MASIACNRSLDTALHSGCPIWLTAGAASVSYMMLPAGMCRQICQNTSWTRAAVLSVMGTSSRPGSLIDNNTKTSA